MSPEHRGFNILRGQRSSSFWLPRNLSTHIDRQASTRDTVLAKSREMTDGGGKGKDDRKQNTFSPLVSESRLLVSIEPAPFSTKR
jgi:hypothetical protein